MDYPFFQNLKRKLITIKCIIIKVHYYNSMLLKKEQKNPYYLYPIKRTLRHNENGWTLTSWCIHHWFVINIKGELFLYSPEIVTFWQGIRRITKLMFKAVSKRRQFFYKAEWLWSGYITGYLLLLLLFWYIESSFPRL